MRRLPNTLAVALVLAISAAARAQDVRREDKPAEPTPAPTLTRPPELIEGAEPTYPPDAAAAGLEASVTVRITVDATGAVSRVDVVNPAGHGFDEAAVEAARRYRFQPAEWDGKPGPITVETTIHFKLRVVEPPPPDEPPPTDGPAKGTSVIAGVVKERGSRRKLAGVTISLPQLGIDVVTDAEGRFRIEDLPAGSYDVVAISSGYDRFQEKLQLAEGERAETALYLRAKGGTPYETVVQGERERLEVTKHTLDRRQLTTVPGTFGDPIRVIQSLPGMARSPYSTGLLLIRGSNPDDSGVYIDGVRVPLLYHFLGGPSILNPEFLEDLSLYPGGFPVRFGRSIAGVVEVNTRPSASDGIHGAADIDFIDTGVYLRAPVGKNATFAIAGRRSYIDTLLPFVLPEPDPGETLVVVPVYWDYQARLDLKLPRGDRLSFLAFGSDDRLDVLQTDLEKDETIDLGTHIGFHRFRGTYTTRLAPSWKLVLTPMLGYDVVSFAAGEQSSTEITDTFVGLREQVVGEPRKGLQFDLGFDVLYRLTDYRVRLPVADNVAGFGGGNIDGIEVPPQDFARSADIYSLAAYVQAAWDVGRGVKLVPGVRADTYLIAGEPRLSFDPRLVARWQIAKRTAVKGYVGLFHQPPQPEGFDSRYGNPDLRLERAIQTGLGVEQRIGRHIEIDAEVYYIDRDDLAVFSTEVVRRPDGTLDPLYWESEAVGRTYGFEVIVKHEVTRNFYGWLSYTLSRSEQRRHPESETTLTAFDQTHNFIGVASYRTDGGWEFGARFQLTTGRPDTPTNGGTFDADDGDYGPYRGERRSIRTPLFNQLDLRIDKTWVFRTWMIGAYLDVVNVYNAENPEATQWDYRFRESAPIRGMPIIPTLGVKGQW